MRFMLIFAISILCLVTGNAQINESSSLPEIEFSQLSQRDPNPLGEKALAIHSEQWKHGETEHFIYHFVHTYVATPISIEAEFHYRVVARELERDRRARFYSAPHAGGHDPSAVRSGRNFLRRIGASRALPCLDGQGELHRAAGRARPPSTLRHCDPSHLCRKIPESNRSRRKIPRLCFERFRNFFATSGRLKRQIRKFPLLMRDAWVAPASRVLAIASRDRELSSAFVQGSSPQQSKIVSARRRNQHARRGRYPERRSAQSHSSCDWPACMRETSSGKDENESRRKYLRCRRFG